eukprot:SAG11_NODE_1140_length_5709_cov_11.137611_5_plen_95_part_00
MHEELANLIPDGLNNVLWEAVEVLGAANPIGVTLIGMYYLLPSPFSLPAYQVVSLERLSGLAAILDLDHNNYQNKSSALFCICIESVSVNVLYL